MFIVALIYAANYTIAKPVMSGETPFVRPFGFIMMRVLAATALIWISHLLFVREKVERKDILRLALCGVFGVAGNQLTFFYGLNLTTPINAALIMLTTPILVLILSMIVFREKLTGKKGVGILFGLLGATMLVLNNSSDIPDAPDPGLGNIFVGINASFYACYLVLVKPMMDKYSAFTTLKWVFFFGTIYVIPFGYNQMLEINWTTMPSHIFWSIAFVLFFVTFLTYVMNGAALAVVKPTVSSTYIYLQPLLASVIAVSAGKDNLTLAMLFSAALIFVGVYLVSLKSDNENAET